MKIAITTETAKKIEAAYDNGFFDFGLRVMTGCVDVQEGSEIENSYHWEDGNITEDQMSGVSTVGFEADFGEVDEESFNKALSLIDQYKEYGAKMVIVGGNHNADEIHNDEGEKVISNAVCVAVL